jgi:hypothetical protein
MTSDMFASSMTYVAAAQGRGPLRSTAGEQLRREPTERACRPRDEAHREGGMQEEVVIGMRLHRFRDRLRRLIAYKANSELDMHRNEA